MSLIGKYKAAGRLISRLPPEDRRALKNLSLAIRDAERALLTAAEPLMHTCLRDCGGMCCRNLDLDAVISHWDFIFILASDKSLGPEIEKHLSRHNPLFPMDCIFLKSGRGPCIFPQDLRPEICLTTFCGRLDPVKNEIKLLKTRFRSLTRLVRSATLPILGRFLIRRDFEETC